MKKSKLFTTILCIMALQGCTTHHYHYEQSGDIGIAESSKGISGQPGDLGELKAQRKAEIDRSLLSQSGAGTVAGNGGLKGAEGMAQSPRGTAGNPQVKEEEDSTSFDVPFAKKAILNILQWCIVARCGS